MNNFTTPPTDEQLIYNQQMTGEPLEQYEEEELQEEYIEGEFYENLADKLPEEYLFRLGRQLKDSYERDMNTRTQWTEQLTEGIKLLGLSPVETTEDSIGLSKNYNSAYLKTWLRLSSEMIGEVFPPNDMVSVNVLGTTTEELDQLADLAKQDTNYKLCRLWKDFIPQFERAVSWMFISGKVLMKVYYDEFAGRPYVKMIAPEDAVVNEEATCLEDAERISHLFTLTDRQLRTYQVTGHYLDIDPRLLRVSSMSDSKNNGVKEAVNETNGTDTRADATYSFEYTYDLVETELYLSLDEIKDNHAYNHNYSKKIRNNIDHVPIPYTAVFSPEDGRILRLARNWDPNSMNFKRLENLIDLTFVPGMKFWGYGMAHLATQNAQVATSLQRMLLDAGKLANFPGGFRKKGVRFDRSDILLQPFQWQEIETGGDPIRDALMPIPVNEPSSILQVMLKEMESAIMEIGGITSIKVEDLNSNATAAGTLALLDKQNKPQSAVIRRFQRSINDMFQILQRIFVHEMGEDPIQYPTQQFQGINHAQLYGQPIELISSADPSLNSLAARIMQSQALLEMANQAPQLHNLREVYKRLYMTLKVPNIDKVLLTEEELQQQQQQQAEAASQQIDPNQILLQDVEMKKQSADQKHMIEQQKVEQEFLMEQERLKVEELRIQAEMERQRLKDKVDMYNAHLNYTLKKAELEAKLGAIVPEVEEPDIDATEVEEFIRHERALEEEERQMQQLQQEMLAEQQASGIMDAGGGQPDGIPMGDPMAEQGQQPMAPDAMEGAMLEGMPMEGMPNPNDIPQQ